MLRGRPLGITFTKTVRGPGAVLCVTGPGSMHFAELVGLKNAAQLLGGSSLHPKPPIRSRSSLASERDQGTVESQDGETALSLSWLLWMHS